MPGIRSVGRSCYNSPVVTGRSLAVSRTVRAFCRDEAMVQVTQLLEQARDGDTSAKERLLEITYDELRRLADGYMRQERVGHTMQATALVHSACLHLLQGQNVPGSNRGQFLAYLAKSMRNILVSYARSRGRLKRGAGGRREPLADQLEVAGAPNSDLIDLSEAMDRLALADGRKADVVELKYFGGLTNREAADALGVSVATIERDWDVARLWLLRELSKVDSNEQ